MIEFQFRHSYMLLTNSSINQITGGHSAFLYPKCTTQRPIYGGTMRVIADITDQEVIQKILDHVEAQPPR